MPVNCEREDCPVKKLLRDHIELLKTLSAAGKMTIPLCTLNDCGMKPIEPGIRRRRKIRIRRPTRAN